MKSQRGVIAEIYLYGLAAVAALGVIYGCYKWIDNSWETHAGIVRGQAIKQGQWDAANVAAQIAADKERAERSRLAGEQSARLAQAETKARDADTRWRQARAVAAAANVPLDDCSAQQVRGLPEPTPGVAGSGLRLATTLHFSYQFLREYDSAWTDQSGQPVFPDTGGSAQAAGAASPVDAAILLANHDENASRCSANSRQMNSLLDLLGKLGAPVSSP